MMRRMMNCSSFFLFSCVCASVCVVIARQMKTVFFCNIYIFNYEQLNYNLREVLCVFLFQSKKTEETNVYFVGANYSQLK